MADSPPGSAPPTPSAPGGGSPLKPDSSMNELLTLQSRAEPFTNIHEFLVELKTLAPEERAEILDQKAAILSTILGKTELVSEAFNDFLEKDSKTASCIDRESDHWKVVGEAAETSRKRQRKSAEALKTIEGVWGADTYQKLFSHITSDNGLSQLRALAKRDDTAEQVQQQCNVAIIERLTHPGRGKSNKLTIQPSDMTKVRNGDFKHITFDRKYASSNGFGVGRDGWIVPINIIGIEGIEEADDEEEEEEEEETPEAAATSEDVVMTGIPEEETGPSSFAVSGPGNQRVTRSQARHLVDQSASISDSSSTAAAPSSPSVEELQEARKGKKRKLDNDEKEFANDCGDEEASKGEQKGCGCAPKISRKRLNKYGKVRSLDAIEKDGMIRWYGGRKELTFCYAHLKMLGGLYGLQTKRLNQDQLQTRLSQIFDAYLAGTVGNMKASEETYTWFRRLARPARPSDALGPYKFRPQAVGRFKIGSEEAADLRSYFHIDIDEWNSVGSVVLPCFNWWKTVEYTGLMKVSHDTLYPLFLEEFDMYKHHLREINGKPNYGWLRNMFFSLAQQVMRQDPAYYAYYIALREDHSVNLVSYPYYAKYQVQGDSTAFKHIDINIDNLVHKGRGAMMIQGSVSLDDEQNDDCTIILPGMQNNIRPWAAILAERGLSTKSFVHKITNEHFNIKDEEHFNTKWTPQPCKSTQVRITQPHLPHGALGDAKRVRRTMLPWFVSFQEDLETVETSESGTYSELSTAHRDLVAARATPSGLANRYGVIPLAFPAAVPLTGMGPLSDALVAQTRHDKPTVVAAKKAFLTGTNAERDKFLADYRQNCVIKSYFVNKERGTLDNLIEADERDESEVKTIMHGHEDEACQETTIIADDDGIGYEDDGDEDDE